jgi:hypothetical protein
LLSEALEQLQARSPLFLRGIPGAIDKAACVGVGPGCSMLVHQLADGLCHVKARCQMGRLPKGREITEHDVIPDMLVEGVVHTED